MTLDYDKPPASPSPPAATYNALQVVYNTDEAVKVLTETAVSIDPLKAPYLQHILVPPAMKVLLEGDDPQAAAEAALKLYEVKAVKSKPKAPRAEQEGTKEGQGEGEGAGVGGGKGKKKSSSGKANGKKGKDTAAPAAAPKTTSSAAAAAGGASGKGSSKGRGSKAGGAAAAAADAGGGDEVVVYRRYRLLSVATEQFDDPDNSLASAVMMTCRAYNAELRAVRMKGGVMERLGFSRTPVAIYVVLSWGWVRGVFVEPAGYTLKLQ